MVSSPIDGDFAVEKIFLDFLGSRTTFDDCCRNSKLKDGLDGGGLLAADRLAIWIYTSHFSNWYAQINSELWSGRPSVAVSNFARILHSALRKLPAHVGGTYRGYDVSAADFPKFDPPGRVLSWLGFTSTTIAEDQIYPGNTLFTIHSQNGRLIGDYADDPNEKEVTFIAGTKFHVLGVERRGSKWVIELEEVGDVEEVGDAE
jgi:NAD:arginine ADP-ribosyltransferase